MKHGIELIAEERQRQTSEEGWTPEHDDEHRGEEMAWAAVCYAAPWHIFRMGRGGTPEKTTWMEFRDPWPKRWSNRWDKREKHNHLKRLTIAGALIAAEIDRIQRAGGTE